jgi:tripartite-type tricarboxylate transporter receptor subunit TctC
MQSVSTRPTFRAGRPTVVHALAALLATVPLAATGAEEWPAKPIRLIVPGAAGSTSDLVSRTIADELSRRLGQPVVVLDKPGAGGTIAMAEAARAAPDGYTIAFVTQGSLVVGQALYAAPGFDSVADFAPVAYIGGVANVLILDADNPAHAVRDLVAAARSKPGSLTYSSGGNGSSHHLSAALFASMTGIDLVHVAYRAPGPAMQAVLTGEVTMAFLNVPTVLGEVRAGRVKALAVTSRSRSPLLPEVPTMEEQGVPGYDVTTWFGVVAPKATPAAVVNRLNAEINRMLATPSLSERWQTEGYEVAAPTSPAEFGRLIRSELARWTPIVKASGASTN